MVFLKDPDSGKFKSDFHLWGFLPSFIKDPSTVSGMINARAETLEQKPSFKKAFKYRRCVIPASGFYEWKKVGKEKQPWYFSPTKDPLFCFAGIWEAWHGPDGEQLNTCAIITTEPNKLVGKVHRRMPVILQKNDVSDWLKETSEVSRLNSMLKAYPDALMQSWMVDRMVNNPGNDLPSCIDKLPLLQPELF